jgi:transposase
MNDYTLDADKLAELRAAHRATRDKREADRIKAVVLLATGWSAKAVTEYLQTSRIKLVFLPAYAPNLNLIERLWKFFKPTEN